jgi:hypothetical protein
MRLTAQEQKVVDALKVREGGIYSNEIATYAGIDQRSIAGVVSSLVQKKVVSKDTFGPGDEFIYLTDE